MKYEVAVEKGRAIAQAMEDDQWRIGEIVHQLDLDRQRLNQFAVEVGINFDTLKRYRNVYRAWEGNRPLVPFSVAQELAAHPDREKIVRARPNITREEARQEMEIYSRKATL